MNRKGKLYFRYGTMGSAKTALLLTSAYNFEERGMKYVCMKPIIDTRDNKNVIKSRIGIERECRWIYNDTDLYQLAQEMFEENLAVIDWFLIDEAQFLTPEQVDQLARIVDDYGSNVVCYGLRTDFKSKMFEGSRRLFEIADSIDEIKSTCTCGRKTIINARIDSNGDFVEDGAQVEIGGDDRYIAVLADLDVASEKISYFMIPSKTVIQGGEKNVIKTAVREALIANGNADVLVGLNTQIKYDAKGQPESITVTGYPAKYVNFRSPSDEEILKLKADNGSAAGVLALPFMKKK